MHQRSEKCVTEGSKYVHWIGLYLSFHLNWVLDPFVISRLQNLQTSEVTFAHVISPLRSRSLVCRVFTVTLPSSIRFTSVSNCGKASMLRRAPSRSLSLIVSNTIISSTRESRFCNGPKFHLYPELCVNPSHFIITSSSQPQSPHNYLEPQSLDNY